MSKGWETWGCLVWRRQRGDLINTYKYTNGRSQVDGARLFSVVPSNKTRGCGHTLELRTFYTNMREKFCTSRGTEHWNKLPREVVFFSGNIHNSPGCLLVWPAVGSLLYQQEWTRWSPEVPSNSYDSVILWKSSQVQVFGERATKICWKDNCIRLRKSTLKAARGRESIQLQFAWFLHILRHLLPTPSSRQETEFWTVVLKHHGCSRVQHNQSKHSSVSQ